MAVSLKRFRQLCVDIAKTPKYLEKIIILRDFIYLEAGSEVELVIKMLLPSISKNAYYARDKQLIKIFSKIIGLNVKYVEEKVVLSGDAAYTLGSLIKKFDVCYSVVSKLSLQEVDQFLTLFSSLRLEQQQVNAFKKIIPLCTPNDLRCVLRLVKKDIRINMGAKHVLASLHKNAYNLYNVTNNLELVVKQSVKNEVNTSVQLMNPVRPMLATLCSSFTEAKNKCLGKVIVELKYDGERIQIHKQQNEFKYFSRSLKPVTLHKVDSLERFLNKAINPLNDYIIDGEIILINDKEKQILPFGTLGVHKKTLYKHANVCLFIFDCLYFNGEVLIQQPLYKRREILLRNVNEISNRVLLSEIKIVKNDDELVSLLHKVLSKGIEGFVLKDSKGCYEPGIRRWLKIKKDCAQGGIADTLDLLIVGAYYGRGYKSGIYSSFLMGCYDETHKVWLTVTKCSCGTTKNDLIKLQETLPFIPFTKTPNWLVVHKKNYPDVIISDVTLSIVLEVSGLEFTKSQTHTAAGLSIRFPRCCKIRNDKNYKNALTLRELKHMYKNALKKCQINT